jgi:hypothetical protein
MAKITKERLQNVCDYVNAGILPSYAGQKESLSGMCIKALKTAKIIHYDEEADKWSARNVTDARYQRYKDALKVKNQVKRVTRKTKTITVENTESVKIGFFARVWNAILNK